MRRLTPASVTMIMFMVVGLLVVAYIGKSMFAVTEKRPEVAFRNVPMPIADLPPGTVITKDHIGMGPIAIKDLKSDMLLADRVVIGRVVKELLPAAKPIRSGQLYEPGAQPPLKLSKGMRAVTVEIRGSSSIVDGLIKPGEYVDILFSPTSMQDDPRMEHGMIMTLFEGVKIVAINRMFTQGAIEGDRNSLTFELTPEQASIITIAREKGMLTVTYNPNGKGDGTLALRNKDRVTLEEILGLPPLKKPEPPPAPPPPFISQIYRGPRRSQIEFRRDGQIMENSNGTRINLQGPGMPPGAMPPGAMPPANVDPNQDPTDPTTPAAPTGTPNAAPPPPAANKAPTA